MTIYNGYVSQMVFKDEIDNNWMKLFIFIISVFVDIYFLLKEFWPCIAENTTSMGKEIVWKHSILICKIN